VVFKTTNEDDLIADLAQTFANLRHYRWKLNPEKCIFGVRQASWLHGEPPQHRGKPHQGQCHPQYELTHHREERHNKAHQHDGGARSLYQQAWRERPALLQAAEKV
jgi:hypothetical protein